METKVDEPPWLRTASWLGCPAAGAALGVVIWAAASWIAALPAFPLQGIFRLLDSLSFPWSALTAVVAGAILGFAFAVVWARDRLIVTVSENRVTLKRGEKTRRIEAELAAVYLDGKQLVLSTVDGRELAREKTDLERASLAKAFTEHGHPWRDEPPAEH